MVYACTKIRGKLISGWFFVRQISKHDFTLYSNKYLCISTGSVSHILNGLCYNYCYDKIILENAFKALLLNELCALYIVGLI